MMSFPDTNLEQLLSKIKLDQIDVTPVIDKNWILSCSAGADSILALHVLYFLDKIYPKKNRKCIIYFLDHGDQNRENSLQRKKILELNIQKNEIRDSGMQLEFSYFYRDMKKISHKLKGNFEFVSARLRRKHLKRICQKNPDSVVVTGHNMSDWLETLLMRINRGASPEKIYPFLPIEKIQNMLFFRPLVLLANHEIRALCSKYFLEYWDDPSNFSGNNNRSRIRKNVIIENPDGCRISVRNFFQQKKEMIHQNRGFQDKLLENLVVKKPGREYWLYLDFFVSLSPEFQTFVIDYLLQDLDLWPVSFSLKKSMARFPGFYKSWAIEKENWSGKIYLVFRRGRARLNIPPLILYNIDNHFHIMADQITKKHYIQFSYGKKGVKKIFSEKNLSHRQRKALPLYANQKQPFEILFIPLSIFGLKDIAARDSGSI